MGHAHPRHPWLLETRKQEAEKKKKRAEKFEEMVSTLFEYEHWLDTVRDIRLYHKVDELLPTMPPSPFSKLHAISAIHFPEFQEKIEELETAGRRYEKWMIEARQKLIKGDRDFIFGFDDEYKAFAIVARRLLVDFRKHAKENFQ